MKSSIRSAVVLGSTVTALSAGGGGGGTDAHLSTIVRARAGASRHVNDAVDDECRSDGVVTNAAFDMVFFLSRFARLLKPRQPIIIPRTVHEIFVSN